MKWPFYVPQKMRIAVILAGIMAVVIISNILVRRSIGDIDRSFTSIYNDRLMPATEIFYITENLYNERIVLEKHLWLGQHDDLHPGTDIIRYNVSIDSILVEFEKTYIVPNEALCLKKFKKSREEYKTIEQQVISLSHAGRSKQAIELFENEGVAAMTQTIKNLHELIDIQSQIGGELLNDSHHIVASANMLSFLEAGVAIVLGLIVHILILSSKAFHKKAKQPFHLN